MSRTYTHEKSCISVNTQHSKQLRETLADAIADRESWTANEERRSNQKLYDILSRCYEVYDEYLRTDNKRQWKCDFSHAIEAIDPNHQKYEVDNKLTLTIVRVVFGDSDMCRKRVSTYAKVLRIAGDNGSSSRVKVADLTAWITGLGGVQEVSRTDSQTALARSEKIAHVSKRLVTLGSVQKIDCLDSVDLVGNYVLLLASVDDDTLSIKHVFKDTQFVDSALSRLYREYKTKEENQVKAKDKARTTSDTRSTANAELEALAA